MSRGLELFVTCSKGVEDLLAAECLQLGLSAVDPARGGVVCRGSLEQAYKLCLWSRLASRVLLKLAEFPVEQHDSLYRGAQSVDWNAHMDADGCFAVDTHTVHKVINNSHFATLKIKDAIVDQFKQACGRRPDVKRDRPDIRINAYINDRACILYLDLSGEPLHIRGYRRETGVAPLKENLAAAILLRSRWPDMAKQGRPMIDPLCGSATLLLEAAYIASDMAPGLLRSYFGFLNWKQHDAEVWDRLLEEANKRVAKKDLPVLIGIEKSYKVAAIARKNIKVAGFESVIEIKQADSVDVIPDTLGEHGLIVTNPPYGKRIGESNELKQLYLDLGKKLKSRFPGWNIALFTANHELARFFGLRAHHRNTLYNGPLKCTLYHYRIRESEPAASAADSAGSQPDTDEVQMFANRLSKNLKHLSRWLRKENVSCYRVYDADIPQYAIAVDVYEDWVHVQEYEPPRSVDAVQAFVRLNEAIDAIARVLGTDQSRIVMKSRKRQSGSEQYRRQDETGDTLIARESGLRFRINLKDYLDTGLFLDHRITRKLIAGIARNKTFLNLFAYTGTATVYAVAGGASRATTVDMSNTYLAWARENLRLNGLPVDDHAFIRADCLAWLAEAREQGRRFDVIFLDPPTFSNSKRMNRTLDLKRDHVDLIEQAMALLDDDGVLIFSSNAKGFRLDQDALDSYFVRDITRLTTSEDFRRKPAHVCWCLAKRVDSLKGCILQPVSAPVGGN